MHKIYIILLSVEVYNILLGVFVAYIRPYLRNLRDKWMLQGQEELRAEQKYQVLCILIISGFTMLVMNGCIIIISVL